MPRSLSGFALHAPSTQWRTPLGAEGSFLPILRRSFELWRRSLRQRGCRPIGDCGRRDPHVAAARSARVVPANHLVHFVINAIGELDVADGHASTSRAAGASSREAHGKRNGRDGDRKPGTDDGGEPPLAGARSYRAGAVRSTIIRPGREVRPYEPAPPSPNNPPPGRPCGFRSRRGRSGSSRSIGSPGSRRNRRDPCGCRAAALEVGHERSRGCRSPGIRNRHQSFRMIVVRRAVVLQRAASPASWKVETVIDQVDQDLHVPCGCIARPSPRTPTTAARPSSQTPE